MTHSRLTCSTYCLLPDSLGQIVHAPLGHRDHATNPNSNPNLYPNPNQVKLYTHLSALAIMRLHLEDGDGVHAQSEHNPLKIAPAKDSGGNGGSVDAKGRPKPTPKPTRRELLQGAISASELELLTPSLRPGPRSDPNP